MDLFIHTKEGLENLLKILLFFFSEVNVSFLPSSFFTASSSFLENSVP